MKHFVLLFAALFIGATSTTAATAENSHVIRNGFGYNNSFIFVNNGITFSVYPDGEFDFYMNNRVNVSAGIGVGPVGVTFNSGFDYNPFVQYDDYGAVIQIENMPVYYDFYGRVSQIGDVNIWYRNGRVRRIGGMRVFYNNLGVYHYHTGFINIYNRYYVYRPFHRFFVRPAIGFALVYNRPYRRFYNPVRYTWYRPYRYNHRRAYVNIGRDYRYNRGWERRSRIYRNDRRVAVRDERGRRDGYRDSGTNRRDNAVNGRRSTAYRNETTRREGNKRNVRNNRSEVVSRKTAPARTVRSKATAQRSHRNDEVARTRTVKRSTTNEGRRQVTRSTKTNRTQRVAPAKKSSRSKVATNRSTSRKPAYKSVNKRSRSSVVSKSPKQTVNKRSATRSKNSRTTSKGRRSL